MLGVWAIIVSICVPAVSAQSANPAEQLFVDASVEFQHDRMADAVPLLQAAIQADPAHGEAIRMLAVAYERIGRTDDAIELLRTSVEVEGMTLRESGRIAFDLAALYQRTNVPVEAVAYYSAALQYDNTIAAAYLNRANTRVATGDYGRAVSDYQLYLALQPDARQRPQIEQMVALLTAEAEAQRVAREEAQRAAEAAAEARRVAEEERQRAEEEQRRAAAERRAQMLNNVLQSLNTASEEARSFELEGEDIETYEEDLDIAD